MDQASVKNSQLMSDMKSHLLTLFTGDNATYGELQRVILYAKLLIEDNAFGDEIFEAVIEDWLSRSPEGGTGDDLYLDGLINGLDLFKELEDYQSLSPAL